MSAAGRARLGTRDVARFALAATLAATAPFLNGGDARAQDEAHVPEPAADNVSASLMTRRHTIAVLELGIIALPTAPLSPSQRGGDTPIGSIGTGDATLQTGIHVLYRGGSNWAVGAGVLFAPQPTNDDQYGGLNGLNRTHARNYLFLGGEARYYPLTLRWIDFWFGATGGGIVIADRYVTNEGDEVPSILGSKQITVQTEGLSIGVEIGLDYMFADRWVAGVAARADRWFLPNIPRCSPIGDCATLSGVIEALEFGLTIGYRIPL